MNANWMALADEAQRLEKAVYSEMKALEPGPFTVRVTRVAMDVSARVYDGEKGAASAVRSFRKMLENIRQEVVLARFNKLVDSEVQKGATVFHIFRSGQSCVASLGKWAWYVAVDPTLTRVVDVQKLTLNQARVTIAVLEGKNR